MFSKRRIISHIVLWIFVVVGIALAFYAISPGLIFKKSFNVWLAIFPLSCFLVYHIGSSIYYHRQFHTKAGSEKRIIRAGVYGKCLHPTCTTIVILGWIVFFSWPDFRVLFSVAWLTAIVLFWINIEKSFFLGRRLKAETKSPEPA